MHALRAFFIDVISQNIFHHAIPEAIAAILYFFFIFSTSIIIIAIYNSLDFNLIILYRFIFLQISNMRKLFILSIFSAMYMQYMS